MRSLVLLGKSSAILYSIPLLVARGGPARITSGTL